MSPWKRPVVAIAATTIALVALMIVTGMGPQVPLVMSLAILVGCGSWFALDLTKVSVESSGLPSGQAPAPTARADRRVMRLRSGLAYGRTDDGSLERLRDSLVDLIDDQLLTAHQIDRSVDPAAASAVLGDELSRFVTDATTARQLDKPRHLARTLTLIEQL